MNPWQQKQCRVTLPPFRRLIQTDTVMAQTLEKFEKEPMAELFFEPDDARDYAVVHADGTVTRVSECVTINGVRWDLVPGRNRVPQSVYEFLMQCPEQRQFMPAPQPDRAHCIGRF